MKKIFVLLSIFLLSFLAACGDTYDEDGFEEVKNYSEEIIPAVDVAIINVGIWIDDQTDENLEEMVKSADEINKINDELWDFDQDAEYNKEEMEDWMIKMSRGEDEEWIINGEDLYPAIDYTEEDSYFLAEDIKKIEDNPTDENIEKLIESASFAKESMEELRKIIANK